MMEGVSLGVDNQLPFVKREEREMRVASEVYTDGVDRG
jgi:hypothetical protein